ncbi:TPA: hypothetical protein MDZ49_002576 [Klebsiella pneumoniae]|nr:Uncharacterised protein [Klebsiella pneumoniae]SXZ96704.1 Uncharacterised protein [Klebsiella pneumoniae]HBQ0674477.1 hypothetical protein [Klebsiella pneumoniae]HBQ0980015.1 hypothetical protein [Klebsiella pneumoniae]HBR3645924.1 hypothetical protein [Klebsiella pneumoniae]
MGQGVFFLLTLFLAYKGLTPDVANISIAIGVLSLIQWCADGGGVFLLGRYCAKNILSEVIGTLYIVRIFYSLVVFVVLFYILPLFYHNDFLHECIKYSFILCVFGAANISGLADFLGKNKIIGPFASLPWLFVSIYIIWEYYIGNITNNQYSSVAIVISYTTGFVISLLVQYSVCWHFFEKTKIKLFSYKKLIFNEVGGFFFSYFLSQSYARLLPILVDMYLGKATAGLFAIAKTFLNIFSQLLMFLRRVENEKIIKVTESSNSSCSDIKPQNIELLLLKMSWRTSKFILATSFVSIGALYCIALLMPVVSQKIVLIWWFISISLSALVIWNYSSILGQSLIISGKTTEYALILFVSLLVNIAINIFLFSSFGLWSIIIAELIMYIIQILIFIFKIRYQRRDKKYVL